MGQKAGKPRGSKKEAPAQGGAGANNNQLEGPASSSNQTSGLDRNASSQGGMVRHASSHQSAGGGPALARKASTQQTASDLSMYARKPSELRKASTTSISGHQRAASSLDAGTLPPPATTPPFMENESQERRTLFDHLVAFYFRNDNERLMNGDVDVDGICDWALSEGSEGVAKLNQRLRDKYGEDLDSFLINAALPEEESDDEETGSHIGENESQQDIETITPSVTPRGTPSGTPSGTPNQSPVPSRSPSPVHSIIEDEEPQSLVHTVALQRPAITNQRRKKTNNQRFALNGEGGLAVSEQDQLDHAPPPDLESQLTQFIQECDPSRSGDVGKFLKFANENGLVALNSELLVAFGKDLKGNTMGDLSSNDTSLDIKKIGIGFDNKVLLEMQNHKLHSETIDKKIHTIETGACSRFRLDTESPVFGMCKCGFDRTAHIIVTSNKVASGTLEKKLASRRASINIDEEKLRQLNITEKSKFREVGNPQPSKPAVPMPSSQKPPPPSSPKKDKSPASSPSLPVTPNSTNSTVMSTTNAPNPPRFIPKPNHSTASAKTPIASKSMASSANTISSSSNSSAPKPTASVSETSSNNRSAPKPPPPAKANPPKPTRPKSLKAKQAAVSSVERLQPGEKKPCACTIAEFQLDMSATEFGICFKCGWKKSDHTAAPVKTEVTQSRPKSIKMNGPREPCNNYKLDLTADSFGACVCGFARQAHAGQSSSQKAISRTLEKRWNHVKEVA